MLQQLCLKGKVKCYISYISKYETSKPRTRQCKKKVPVSKSQQVNNVTSVPTESNSQEKKKEKGNVKLDSFEKTFGGSILCNHLSRLDVDDEYNFDLEKDSKSLLVLKGLIHILYGKMIEIMTISSMS